MSYKKKYGAKRKNELIWLKSPDELNSAIITLKEECEHHCNCRECPLSLVNGTCGLMEYSPIEWVELETED